MSGLAGPKYGEVLKLKNPPFVGYDNPNRWMVIGDDTEAREIIVVALDRAKIKSIPYSDLSAYTRVYDD